MATRHGTPAGCIRHRKRGEKPCGRCLEAYNEYRRNWRRTRRLLGLSAS